MLVKINGIDEYKHIVNVTVLDIDDFGSVIPLKELELVLPLDDKSVSEILKNSSYASVFTEENKEENNSIIILANGISLDELDREKKKTIDTVMGR